MLPLTNTDTYHTDTKYLISLLSHLNDIGYETDNREILAICVECLSSSNKHLVQAAAAFLISSGLDGKLLVLNAVRDKDTFIHGEIIYNTNKILNPHLRLKTQTGTNA